MPSADIQKMIPEIQAYLATQPVERAYLFGSCSRGEERPGTGPGRRVRSSLRDHQKDCFQGDPRGTAGGLWNRN